VRARECGHRLNHGVRSCDAHCADMRNFQSSPAGFRTLGAHAEDPDRGNEVRRPTDNQMGELTFSPQDGHIGRGQVCFEPTGRRSSGRPAASSIVEGQSAPTGPAADRVDRGWGRRPTPSSWRT